MTDAPSIENPIAFLRPIRSASQPPTNWAATPPIPYIPRAKPRWRARDPRCVKYRGKDRNHEGPNRITDRPADRNPGAGGGGRKFRARVRRAGSNAFSPGMGGDVD